MARVLPEARIEPPATVTAPRAFAPDWLLPRRLTVPPEISSELPPARVFALARKTWPPETSVRPV